MKGLKKITLFILCAISMLCSYKIIKPFWDRYYVEMQIEAAAVYGTKNSIEKAKYILIGKLNERGFAFEGNDFVIEKDENNSVSINLAYIDEISIFGVCLKELDFNVETTVHESKAF